MFKDILSISGKPGLHKMISSNGNSIIVESIADGKRFVAYANAKVISLEDISIYTEDEDIPLKDVLKTIFEKEKGGQILNHKESTEKILKYFESILPTYDKERVYVSDMRKVIQWYNILASKKLLTFDEENKKGDTKAEEEAPKATKKAAGTKEKSTAVKKTAAKTASKAASEKKATKGATTTTVKKNTNSVKRGS